MSSVALGPGEKVARVGYFLSREFGTSDYRVHIPLLTHTFCDCHICRTDWDPKWGINTAEIFDATSLVSKHKIIPKRNVVIRNCDNFCDYNCRSCAHSIKNLDNLNSDPTNHAKNNHACMYPFIINIFNSKFGQNKELYKIHDLPDIDTIMYYMKLYGRYGSDSATLYPWVLKNIDVKTYETIKTYIDSAQGCNTELLRKAIKDPQHQRWDELQKLFEQLLACVYHGSYTFSTKEQRNVYKVALKSWRKAKNDPSLVPDAGLIPSPSSPV